MKICSRILAGVLAGLVLTYGINNAKACDFNDVPQSEKDKIVYADSGALLNDGETPYVIINEDVNGTIKNMLYVPGEDNTTGECHVYEVDITGFAGPNSKIEAAEFVLEEGYWGDLYRLLGIYSEVKKSQYLDLVTVVEREEEDGEAQKYFEIYRYSAETGWQVLESLEVNDDIVGLKLKKEGYSLKPEIIVNRDGNQYVVKEGFLGFRYLEPVEREYRNVLGKVIGITQNGDEVGILSADEVYKLLSVSSEDESGKN